MSNTQNKPLFTELNSEESATVNGACYYGRYSHHNSYQPTYYVRRVYYDACGRRRVTYTAVRS